MLTRGFWGQYNSCTRIEMQPAILWRTLRTGLCVGALLFSCRVTAFSEEPAEQAAESPTEKEGFVDGKTASARQSALLNYCAGIEPKKPLYPKEAMCAYVSRVLLDRDSANAMELWSEAARRTFESARDRLAANPQDAHALDPFNKQALLHSWLLCKDRSILPPDIEANTRAYVSLWRHKVWSGYGALNYRLMMDGSGFLAAEQWPGLKDADGLGAEEIKVATKGRLLGYFDEIVHHNFHEYGSPTYAGVDFSAMKMLADFANDREIKSRAALTLDWMLLNVACAWNQGYHTTPAGRAKYLSSTTTSPDAMDSTATIGWIFFGAHRPIRNPGEIHSFWFACPGGYQPPDLFREIAQDRTAPFVHRGSFKDKSAGIRMTIFHTPDYTLASEWELLGSPTDGHYKESRRQMLKWVSDKPFSTFAPMQENPRRPYALKENVANAFGYGENPFGQTLQHEGTLVGITSVPDDYPYYKLYAPFPLTGSILKRIERGGWVCCHAGSMLFAFHTLQPSAWGNPRTSDHCDVLWSDARRNGWILETSPLAPFAGGGVEAELDRFARKLEEKTKVENISMDLPAPHFRYTTLSGHVLEISCRPHAEPYRDQHKIDGQPVDYEKFPLLGNPWVSQDLGSDKLTLSHGGSSMGYDFKAWKRTESPSRTVDH